MGGGSGGRYNLSPIDRCAIRLRIFSREPGALIALAVLIPGFIFGPLVPAASSDLFIKGADISFLHAIEDGGGVYTEGGVPRDALDIFQDHGLNYVRLRLWHSPSDGYNDLDDMLLMAARAKSAGFGLLLDFHYSDVWADPGKQAKPAAWSSLGFSALKDTVREYTRHVITRLKDQNTLPDMVQIGNEIACGMLWDECRICDSLNTPTQWANVGQMVGMASQGVRDALLPGDSVAIVIHIDRGGDNFGSRWFFDKLVAEGVDFDIIGLSFYPWWHGTLDDLGANMRDLATRYEKDIIIAETAYPWTLDSCDSMENIVDFPAEPHPGYPATVDGQRDFLMALMDTVRAVPGGRGRGIFYWSPDFISVPGVGSAWENATLFDFTGEMLSSIAAFDSSTAGVAPSGDPRSPSPLPRTCPNPFNRRTIIHYSLEAASFVTLRVFSMLGREIDTISAGYAPRGANTVCWEGTESDGTPVAPGMYAYVIVAGSHRETGRLLLVR